MSLMLLTSNRLRYPFVCFKIRVKKLLNFSQLMSKSYDSFFNFFSSVSCQKTHLTVVTVTVEKSNTATLAVEIYTRQEENGL